MFLLSFRSPVTMAVIAGVTAFLSLFEPAQATPSAEQFICADRTQIDRRRDWEEASVQEIAPSAGAQTSADLAVHAELSALSYEMYDAVENGRDAKELLPPDLQLVAFIFGDPGRATERLLNRLRDTQTFYGFVADHIKSGRRFIVFRGTLQPNEWLRNLQVRQRPYPEDASGSPSNANVHRGFLQIFGSLELAWEGQRTPFATALPKLITGREATFIGHSLGGALATLAGVDAARRAPEDAERLRLVTFASPRVGDQGFAILAQSIGRIDRVCNVVDLVPAVPPSTRRAPYTHVGAVFRVSSFDWPDLSNKLLERNQKILCWHSIAAYGYMVDPVKPAEAPPACLQ